MQPTHIQHNTHRIRVGQNRTYIVYIIHYTCLRCAHDVLRWDFTIHTVIYGVCIQSWPTLHQIRGYTCERWSAIPSNVPNATELLEGSMPLFFISEAASSTLLTKASSGREAVKMKCITLLMCITSGRE